LPNKPRGFFATQSRDQAVEAAGIVYLSKQLGAKGELFSNAASKEARAQTALSFLPNVAASQCKRNTKARPSDRYSKSPDYWCWHHGADRP